MNIMFQDHQSSYDTDESRDNMTKDDKLDPHDQMNEETFSIPNIKLSRKSIKSAKLNDIENNSNVLLESSPLDLINRKSTRKSKKYLRNEKGINQHSKVLRQSNNDTGTDYRHSSNDSDNEIDDTTATTTNKIKFESYQQENIQVAVQKTSKKTAKSSKSNTCTSAISNNQQVPASSQNKSENNTERIWVQCNTCDKWRSLPSTVDPDKLPDIWTCDLNVYDLERNNCDAPEESYKDLDEEKHAPLKSFFKIWTKKLKSSDRAESRLCSSALTRGKKKKLDVEWIQCSNPSCHKWRAISRNIDMNVLFKRLNKNKHYGGPSVWYCSMNSWDDTTASCSAPQEPLYNCKWNINYT